MILKTNRIIIYGLIVMVALNLTLVVFILTKGANNSPPPFQQPRQMGREMQKRLDLSPTQRKQFRELAREHRLNMQIVNSRQSSVVEVFFNTVKQDSLMVGKDSLLNEVLKLEREKLESTHAHLNALFSILTTEQKPLFEPVLNRIIRSISHKERFMGKRQDERNRLQKKFNPSRGME